MICFQVIERRGANLYQVLRGAMRSKELRTFYLAMHGRRVCHTNPSYSGWMRWSHADGVITCQVVSPRQPGTEWRLFSAFVGRLADRFADLIQCVNIQFNGPLPKGPLKRRSRRARRKR